MLVRGSVDRIDDAKLGWNAALVCWRRRTIANRDPLALKIIKPKLAME